VKVSIVIPSLPGYGELNKECAESYESTAFGAIEIIIIEAPVPFAMNVNEGVRRSKGDIILVANNDTTALPGWYTHLVNHADKGIVSFSPKAECGWLFGASKKIFDEIGEFDEVFENSYEDRDFFIRAALKGYRIILAPCYYAVHTGGKTINQVWGDYKKPTKKRLDACYRNRQHIQRKYPGLDVDHLINSKYFAFYGPQIMQEYKDGRYAKT
jgi:GT2 family glycosyltransferase